MISMLDLKSSPFSNVYNLPKCFGGGNRLFSCFNNLDKYIVLQSCGRNKTTSQQILFSSGA